MFEFLKKLLAGSNEAEVKKLMKTVEQINALEPQTRALSDDQLRAKTDEFRARLGQGSTLDEILPEALRWCARLRRACWASAISTCS